MVSERFYDPQALAEVRHGAALRDFEPTNDRNGSKASDRLARRVRGMSAVPLIATELVTRGSPLLGAISRLMQCSKQLS